MVGLTGTKYGCGIAQCSARTVHLEKNPVRTSSIPVSAAVNKNKATIEGLSEDNSHPVQQAWIAEQVPQCGYCQSGQIMAATSLLKRNANPYDSIQDDPEVLLLSHTIDPVYDNVQRLHDYADRLGVKSSKWHFVTGNKDSIYSIAQTKYFATAMEDKAEPDGFIHSGAFLLIDRDKRIRGKYDGTKESDVDKLLYDIQRLKKENEIEKQ